MAHSGGLTTDVIAPKVLVVPVETPSTTIENAGSGSLVLSGVDLCYSVGDSWYHITAAINA